MAHKTLTSKKETIIDQTKIILDNPDVKIVDKKKQIHYIKKNTTKQTNKSTLALNQSINKIDFAKKVIKKITLHTKPIIQDNFSYKLIDKSTIYDEACNLTEKIAKFLSQLEIKVEETGEARTFNKLEELIQALQKQRNLITQEEDVLLKDIFRKKTLDFSQLSEFCKHVNDKPFGYAGDFMAMEMIWNGQKNPNEYRYRGSSKLGELINAFTLDSASCKANSARINRFTKILSNNTYIDIASIGSGSAIEIFNAAQKYDGINKKRFFLFDQDKNALEAIKKKNATYQLQIEYIQGNIIKTIISDNRQYDLIYSAGMFDYFNVGSSQKLAAKLLLHLKKNGCLIITNAHPNNPTKLWMEYVGNWSLIYKTKKELLSIARASTNAVNIKYLIDTLNVYQYLYIFK